MERVELQCMVCEESVYAAAGRAYCRSCSITFPQPRKTRAELLSVFLLRYYMSKQSPFYHRAGCKYIQNIAPENLIETAEPSGKPCRCVR
jgi:hypothetical protein